MLQSMTGFGQAKLKVKKYHIEARIKSLNGKQLDINIKMPDFIQKYEHKIRDLLGQSMIRGTIDCQISVYDTQGYNSTNLKKQYKQIKKIGKKLNIKEKFLIAQLFAQPYTSPMQRDISWKYLRKILKKSIQKVQSYKQTEGIFLLGYIHKHTLALIKCIDTICTLQGDESVYLNEIGDRILDVHNIDHAQIAPEYLAQIVASYYRLDTSEEISRIREHCRHLFSILEQSIDGEYGKKIGFICQELSRELNTLSAKNGSAQISSHIISARESLEKIKEQSANIL